MHNIRSIPTYYNEFRFRSRLEARWSVVFDELEIKYIYEPEGYILNNGMKYLPDFYLPELDIFFEVKGVMSEYDFDRICNFTREYEKIVVIGYADMTFVVSKGFYDIEKHGDPIDENGLRPSDYEYTEINNETLFLDRSDSSICKCFKCGSYEFGYETGCYYGTCKTCGSLFRDKPVFTGECDKPIVLSDEHIYEFEVVKNIFDKARRIQFEYLGDY